MLLEGNDELSQELIHSCFLKIHIYEATQIEFHSSADECGISWLCPTSFCSTSASNIRLFSLSNDIAMLTGLRDSAHLTNVELTGDCSWIFEMKDCIISKWRMYIYLFIYLYIGPYRTPARSEK